MHSVVCTKHTPDSEAKMSVNESGDVCGRGDQRPNLEAQVVGTGLGSRDSKALHPGLDDPGQGQRGDRTEVVGDCDGCRRLGVTQASDQADGRTFVRLPDLNQRRNRAHSLGFRRLHSILARPTAGQEHC